MNIVAFVLAVCAAIAFLCGIIQALVALKDIITHSLQSGQQKRWIVIILIFVVLTVILGGASYASLLKSDNPSSASSPIATSTSAALRLTSTLTATSAPTSTTGLTPTATATSVPISDYSAAHPGPGCDTGGGTWTAQGVNNITCSTWVSNITTEAWGYLSFQLPNNAAFAANNEISITFSNIDSLNNSCFGLAEQNENTGYLVAYCVNGAWSIYSLSKEGNVIRSLSSSSTAIKSNTTLSLTLVNNTLKFAIDAESHQISISPLQPTNAAIAFYNNGCGNCSAVATNFNYITPAS